MLKSLVSGIKLYLDKRLKEQRDETDERIADAKWHETTTAQLFSETVTTEGDDAYWGGLAYRGAINADTLTIVFDGETYVCPKQEYEGTFYYGATYDGETDTYDFTEFPFVFCTSPHGGYSENYVQTVTAGTHTISASAKTITYTDTFVEAVKSIAGSGGIKEVETIEEADIAVVTVTRRVASTNQGTNITIYKDNDTVQFLATSVNKYLDPNVYYFWKDRTDMLSNFAYRLFPSNDGLLIMDNAEIDTSSGASLDVYGIGNYGLTSSNASWKFYNIGLTLSSDGDGGGSDSPK